MKAMVHPIRNDIHPRPDVYISDDGCYDVVISFIYSSIIITLFMFLIIVITHLSENNDSGSY